MRWQVRDRIGICVCLEGLADLSTDASRSARFLGAAERLREMIGHKGHGGHGVTGRGARGVDKLAARLQSGLGEAAFTAAWRSGRELALDQVVEDALAFDDIPLAASQHEEPMPAPDHMADPGPRQPDPSDTLALLADALELATLNNQPVSPTPLTGRAAVDRARYRLTATWSTGPVRSTALAALFAATSVFAQAWQPGLGAQGDNTYLGAIDTPSNGASISTFGPITVSGWFVDTAAEGWAGADDVQVFLGPMDGGGKLLARGSIGQDRPDVAGTLGNPAWVAAGWQATVDPASLPFGPSTLSVYLHTPAKGWWMQQVSVLVGQIAPGTGETLAPAPAAHGDPPKVTVSSPREGEVVSTRLRKYTLSGTASDPARGPRGIDWVDVWFNGEANADNAVFLGSLTLDADGIWSVDFDPHRFPPIDSNLYVYAHSAVTGKTLLKVVHFFLENRPT